MGRVSFLVFEGAGVQIRTFDRKHGRTCHNNLQVKALGIKQDKKGRSGQTDNKVGQDGTKQEVVSEETEKP